MAFRIMDQLIQLLFREMEIFFEFKGLKKAKFFLFSFFEVTIYSTVTLKDESILYTNVRNALDLLLMIL